jgi:hypothetical protein
MNVWNNQHITNAYVRQREYIKQHPNQPLPSIDISEIEPMIFDSWLSYVDLNQSKRNYLEADYQAFVKNVEEQNKKHKNWTPMQPLTKAEWLRWGKPQHY